MACLNFFLFLLELILFLERAQAAGTLCIYTEELIIGILVNGLLGLVNCRRWIKSKRISLYYQILTVLAASRICLLILFFTNLFITSLYPSLIVTLQMMRIGNNIWTVTNHFSIWLATCLGVFYFLKIANFSNSLFLYLKWRVKKAVSVILLGSLVLLFINVLSINLKIDKCINELGGNSSYSFSFRNSAQCQTHVTGIHTVFLSVPFGVSLSSCLLLIFSLWRHHKNMQQHAQECRDASTVAHIRALQSVIAFLLLYTIFFLAHFVQIWEIELLEKTLLILFCWMVAVSFPLFHSCVLLLEDVNLRQASLSVLCRLRCRSNNMDTSCP